MTARTRTTTGPSRTTLIVIVLGLAMAACGSESPDTAPGTTDASVPSAATTSEASTTTAPASAQDLSQIDWAIVDLTTIDWATVDMSQVDFTAMAENPTIDNLDSETTGLIGSRIDPGSAKLTIGEQTWHFDRFLCAFGHGATQSDVYSFTSDTRGDHEGVSVQVQANIRDESGQGRFEGADLSHQVFLQDVTNLEDPTIHLSFSASQGILITGDTLVAEGLFDDELTELVVEEMPGTLEATCGHHSRR